MANGGLVGPLAGTRYLPFAIGHWPLAPRHAIRIHHARFAAFGERSMDAVMVTGLGMAGTALSTLSLVPQVVHTWRTRSAADLSATWLAIALLSMLVWISYGSLVAAPAIVW